MLQVLIELSYVLPIFTMLSSSCSLVVEVNFNLDSYSFKENAGQVSITLRITGQLYIPVYAIVEFHNGTATGECA